MEWQVTFVFGMLFGWYLKTIAYALISVSRKKQEQYLLEHSNDD